MRRGTTLASEAIVARLADAAERAAPTAPAGWDGEPTEPDLRLDFSRLQSAPHAAAADTPSVNDDDLPLLDDSEFVAALSLDELEAARRGTRSPELSRSEAVTTTTIRLFHMMRSAIARTR